MPRVIVFLFPPITRVMLLLLLLTRVILMISEDIGVEMVNTLDINAPSLNVLPITSERLNEENCEANLMVKDEENNGFIVVSSNNDGEHDHINALIGVIEGPIDAIIEPVFAVEDFSPLITSSGAKEMIWRCLLRLEKIVSSVGNLYSLELVACIGPMDVLASNKHRGSDENYVASVSLTCNLKEIENVHFINVPIELVSSDGLKEKLSSNVIDNSVDQSDRLDGYGSSPCWFAGDGLEEVVDDFNELHGLTLSDKIQQKISKNGSTGRRRKTKE
ncbi:hypothetical protein M5K25_027311 [Dendrobium thyrsiflorum]|uniref:Uncharacterized protein n=1 Tax=Dendrobium thyrsiflorum TaxID=117978 RepID=A0ABD0TZN0_DENTH